MNIPSLNINQSPIFNLPYEKAFYFDSNFPGKLLVISGNKKLEIDAAETFPLNGVNLPMEERGDVVLFSVVSKDGELFRVGMKTSNFAAITHFLVEDLFTESQHAKQISSMQARVNKLSRMSIDFTNESTLLFSMGLTKDKYQEMQKFYNAKKPDLEKLTVNTIFRRGDTKLARSLAYVPNGRQKGMYALLKTHGYVDEVGLGAFSVVTFALPLDVTLPIKYSQFKVFKSSKKSQHQPGESAANKDLINENDSFVVGSEFNYRGPLRSRIDRGLNGNKYFIPRENNVEKVGYLLDYLEGGSLSDLVEKRKAYFDFIDVIAFALKYACKLAIMHDKGIVQNDQKPGNVFLTKECDPRIGDFGLSGKKGHLKVPCGSFGYVAPETVQALLDNKKEGVLDTPIDIWGFGLILLSLIGGIDDWIHSCGQVYDMDLDWKYMLDNLDHLKLNIFRPLKQKFPKIEPLIYPIHKCLQLKPGDRLTATELVNRLGVIYYSLCNSQ